MSSENFYEKVEECNYDGCIQNLVCSFDCDAELCDDDLFAIYSETGMFCN